MAKPVTAGMTAVLQFECGVTFTVVGQQVIIISRGWAPTVTTLENALAALRRPSA